MAGEINVSNLDGNFKRLYADKIQDLIPDNVVLVNMIPFQKSDRLGDSYRQPVVVAQEHGYTYGGSDGTAFSLNEAEPMQTKDANVKGYESVLRSKISYAVAARSQTSEAAFEQGTKLVVATMLKSFAKRLEISMLYGQKELALVDANTSSLNTLVVSDASWAPGIWIGLENAKIRIFSANLGTDRVSTARKVTAINLNSKTITFDGAAVSLTAGDRVLLEGAYTIAGGWAEMRGLHSIMRALPDGSTDLFGINPASYNTWQSTVYDVGSADLSFEKIQEAVAIACGRGLDKDLVVLVSQKTWAKLCTDQAALREYDSSYKRTELENGSEAITFFSQNGKLQLMPTAFMKEGMAMAFPEEALMRIGSTDVTFNLPGAGEDKFFKQLENASGYELRSYSDQALFCYEPNSLILLENITNS
jgi:hypothetical protein